MLTSILTAALLLSAAPRERPAPGFEQGIDIRLAKANNTRLAAEGAGLRVEYLPTEWPNVTFASNKPWDWSGFTGFALDLTNNGRESIQFGVRIDDDPTADGLNHCRTGTGTVSPGRTAHVVVSMGVNSMDVGMRGQPMETSGLTLLSGGGTGPFNLRHITAFQIFMHNPVSPRSLVLSNFRLVSLTSSLDGIVDEWGQYSRGDWPGKLHSDAELGFRLNREKRDLSANPALPGFDKYGGWVNGPTLRSTGYFRTQKLDGKWWLVTPEGKLFFSTGMDCLNSDGKTFITGREKMFTKLPERGGDEGKFYSRVTGVHSGPVKEGETYDFREANLARKFGPLWRGQWLDHSLQRLRAWGFNTIGNWSDPSLYGRGRTPYVVTIGVGGDHARVASGQDYWGKMHDPFDPRFAEDVRTSVRGVARNALTDPWCVGWFVDNEISWGGDGSEEGRCGLAIGSLAGDAATSPAKRAIIAHLKSTYSGIGTLNSAWATSFESWEDLNGPTRLAGPMNEARTRDCRAFVRAFAAQYFKTIRDEVKRAAPNHLYLGCRFAWHTPEAVDAASEFCDVVSFNIYQPALDPGRRGFYASLNKPCIIGEFHFGALDRGMFHTGLVSTSSQQERARTYIDYLRSVLDDPSFVGCHWFQYADEPLTGRWFDGENYNIGFVTVTDTPYPEMVRAAKQVHGEMYKRRLKGSN